MANRPPSKFNKRYSAEFKRDAVALLRSSGRSIAQVAKELGISDVTLAGWAREQDKQQALTDEERQDQAEAARLRKRIKELEQEIDILKRFTAYWVKEGDK